MDAALGAVPVAALGAASSAALGATLEAGGAAVERAGIVLDDVGGKVLRMEIWESMEEIGLIGST